MAGLGIRIARGELPAVGSHLLWQPWHLPLLLLLLRLLRLELLPPLS